MTQFLVVLQSFQTATCESLHVFTNSEESPKAERPKEILEFMVWLIGTIVDLPKDAWYQYITFFCWRTPISKLCQCLFLSIVLLVTRWLGDSKIFWKVLLPRPTTFWRPRNRSLSLRFPQSSDVRCSDSAMLSPESQRTYFFGKFEWPNRQQMMEC